MKTPICRPRVLGAIGVVVCLCCPGRGEAQYDPTSNGPEAPPPLADTIARIAGEMPDASCDARITHDAGQVRWVCLDANVADLVAVAVTPETCKAYESAELRTVAIIASDGGTQCDVADLCRCHGTLARGPVPEEAVQHELSEKIRSVRALRLSGELESALREGRILLDSLRVEGRSYAPLLSGGLEEGARTALALGDAETALKLVDEALAVSTAGLGPRHPAVARSRALRAEVLIALGFPNEARDVASTALEEIESRLWPEHMLALEARRVAMDALLLSGRPDAAVELWPADLDMTQMPPDMAAVGALAMALSELPEQAQSLIDSLLETGTGDLRPRALSQLTIAAALAGREASVADAVLADIAGTRPRLANGRFLAAVAARGRALAWVADGLDHSTVTRARTALEDLATAIDETPARAVIQTAASRFAAQAGDSSQALELALKARGALHAHGLAHSGDALTASRLASTVYLRRDDFDAARDLVVDTLRAGRHVRRWIAAHGAPAQRFGQALVVERGRRALDALLTHAPDDADTLLARWNLEADLTARQAELASSSPAAAFLSSHLTTPPAMHPADPDASRARVARLLETAEELAPVESEGATVEEIRDVASRVAGRTAWVSWRPVGASSVDPALLALVFDRRGLSAHPAGHLSEVLDAARAHEAALASEPCNDGQLTKTGTALRATLLTPLDGRLDDATELVLLATQLPFPTDVSTGIGRGVGESGLPVVLRTTTFWPTRLSEDAVAANGRACRPTSGSATSGRADAVAAQAPERPVLQMTGLATAPECREESEVVTRGALIASPASSEASDTLVAALEATPSAPLHGLVELGRAEGTGCKLAATRVWARPNALWSAPQSAPDALASPCACRSLRLNAGPQHLAVLVALGLVIFGIGLRLRGTRP